MKKYLLFLTPMLALMSVFFISAFRLGQHHQKPQTYTIQHNTFWVNPDDTWGPAPGPSTIGSACTMKESRFDAQTAKTGHEASAWYWRDAQGQFCADMHHVNNPDAGMDDWRSVSIEPASYQAIFERQADAVQWVESQPYRAKR